MSNDLALVVAKHRRIVIEKVGMSRDESSRTSSEISGYMTVIRWQSRVQIAALYSFDH